MAGTHPEPTEPRIVKKKKAHHGAHGGAWKVAYADFVTAMMALFIVLWIMSQSQSIRQNVAQYFKNPGLLPGASGLMESSDMGGEMPTPGHSQELQTPSPLTPDLAVQEKAMEEVKKRITEIIAQLPDLGRLKDQVLMEISDEGLRVELLDKENSHFFDVGSANLKPETKSLLQHVAQELARLPNQIIIEGHTDSRPYGTTNYTNWELSADRANAARRVIEGAGLKPGQVLSVRGYADQKLRNPQDPMDVQNRRVSILVLFPQKSASSPVSISPPELEKLNKAQESPANPTSGATTPSKPEESRTPTPSPPVRKPAASGGKGINPPKEPAGPVAGVLEDKVRQELQELLKLPQPGNSPSNPMSRAREPKERLGW